MTIRRQARFDGRRTDYFRMITAANRRSDAQEDRAGESEQERAARAGGKTAVDVIIEEETAKQAKIMAIEDGTNVSRVAEELLSGWLAGTYKLKK